MKTSICEPLENDTARQAKVIVEHPNGAIDEPFIDASSYQALLGALRLAEETLQDEIKRLQNRPGGLSILRPRIEKLELDREAVIEVLCTLDI